MNRFDYFTDIEDTFVRLRGKALYVGPLDWKLIEQWKNAGVPLHVVLRSIEEVFKNHKEKKRTRPIQSLSYCKGEVEAQYKEWLQSRVGANESVPGAVATGSPPDRSPFPKEEVLAYLDKCLLALTSALLSTAVPQPPVDTLNTAHDRLNELRALFEAQPDARKLEDSLTKIERDIDVAVRKTAPPEQIAEARAAAEALFSPYKNNMLPQVYQQQIDTALKNNLRKAFGVPRLSLFHMK